MRCPLTDVAARYTDRRTDNFDIYLPVWLARNNKRVFGGLWVAGELVLGWCAFVRRSAGPGRQSGGRGPGPRGTDEAR
jgi:hypothetical protein